MQKRLLFLAIAISFAVATGVACDSVGESPSPPSDDVRVYWNPDTGQMPTPTDLVRDEESQTLDVPVDDAASDAEAAFAQYLNTLDGYPLSTPIRIPVSDAINEATLNRGLILTSAQGGESLGFDARYDDETSEIHIEPDEPLRAGRRYVVGVRGYEFGLRGAEGQQVIADSAFYLIRSPESLSDHPDAVPGDTEEERQQTADELAAIQDQLQPAFELMAQHNIERQELAAVFEFTTTSEPAVVFDPASGRIPMPNDVLATDDGIDLGIDEDMDDEERHIREQLAEMKGFSISGSAVVESTHDFDHNQPDAQGLRLFERQPSGHFEERSRLERGRLDDGRRIWLRPELTLEPDTEYVYVATDELTSLAGQPHRAQPMGAMLTLDAPLVDGDGATVDQLTDSQAQRLEPLRQRTDELLEHLEQTEDFDRSRVAAAVPFRTTASTDILLDRRAELYREDVSTEVTDIDTTMPSGAAGLLLNNVETVVRGHMTVYDHHDPSTRAFREDGNAQERDVKFVLTLPEDVSVSKPIPVVLFGHGLMTSRELVYLIASVLASEGYAVFAPDLPYHGSRAVCTRDDGCAGDATCDDKGRCINPDGSEADLATIEVSHMIPFLEGTQYEELLTYPVSSGEVFIDLDSIPATRDHFAQALLDLQQSVRVIQERELDAGLSLYETVIEETGLWIGDEVLYLGMSLGGILGSGLSATEPEIEHFVLNVPAADLTRLIEHSQAFRTSFEKALDERDIEEGDDDYFEFMNAARWLFDPIDPLNLVQHTVEQPLTYTDPETGESIDDRQARVLIQQAEGDMVVPNIGTEILSERMGVDYVNYEPGVTDHAFLFDPTNTSSATRDAREDIVEFYEQR